MLRAWRWWAGWRSERRSEVEVLLLLISAESGTELDFPQPKHLQRRKKSHFRLQLCIRNQQHEYETPLVSSNLSPFCHSDIRLKWCLRNCSLELEMTQISNLYSKASFLMSHRLLHWVRDKQLIKNEKWSLISLHKCDPARNSQILLKLQSPETVNQDSPT